MSTIKTAVRPTELLNLADILAPVQDDLAAVQEEIRRQLVPTAGLVHHLLAGSQTRQTESLLTRVSRHLSNGQGKGLRPALVMLSSRLGRPVSRETLVALAASIELMHYATLVHDDIIDEAPLRRNQHSINAVWGNEISVIAGDYLYARAFALAAGSLRTSEMQALARVAETLCRGELAEIEHRFDTDLTEETYLKIIEEKTAILLSACCELGAVVADAAPEAARRMAEFGTAFGLAFQIADDCLDLIGDEASLGKPIGTDVMQGSLSLPLIYLGQSYTPTARRELFEPCFSSHGAHRAATARLVRLAKETGAIDRAYETAHAWAQRAQRAIEPLNGFPFKTHYWSLAEYAVERQA